jgi:DmsE family decaheme c-type cytochrome
MLQFAALAASANGREPVDIQAASDPDETACARCHAKIFNGRVNDYPGPEAVVQEGTHATCAACHGPAEAHIQSGGDKSKIFDPTEALSTQVDEICLKCHAGKHLIFERSAHGKSNVSCIRCHRIHVVRASEHLLKAAQPQLCYECHDDDRPQFSMPFRHKVEEGLILCTDCHDPHGGLGDQLQRSSEQQDLICTKCHTEVAGPFNYEHAIVKTEGCTACHLPHGGPNPHMLTRSRVNTICLLCHLPSRRSSTETAINEAHDPGTTLQACTDCHAEIHGSNESVVFATKK